jgi:hypothetical protein
MAPIGRPSLLSGTLEVLSVIPNVIISRTLRVPDYLRLILSGTLEVLSVISRSVPR